MLKNTKAFTQKLCMMLLLFLGSGCFSSRTENTLNVSSLPSMNDILPAVVIGGGVGGLTAALYFSQANIPCTVIQGHKPGGALSQSHSVRNWPGVKNAPGQVIVGNIVDQIKSDGVQLVSEKVISVDFSV